MSDVFLFHYTIINKNILLTYSVSVHLLLTRSALILADAVIFQNPFSRLIKKKKNPGHFLFITTLSEANLRWLSNRSHIWTCKTSLRNQNNLLIYFTEV